MQANALVAVLAENQRLAVLQVQGVVSLDALVGSVFKDAVVEDLAVLVNLNKGRPLVRRGAPEDLGQMLDIDVDRARDKSRLGADRQ